jgi:alpha-N-acetylglucosamine transferase
MNAADQMQNLKYKVRGFLNTKVVFRVLVVIMVFLLVELYLYRMSGRDELASHTHQIGGLSRISKATDEIQSYIDTVNRNSDSHFI